MCLVLISKNETKNYRLIIAANRDEFYNRPAEKAKFWKEHPELLAGKDLKEGGTWFGVTKSGRIALITNYRDMKNIKEDAPSRGSIVKDFLIDDYSPEEYYDKLKAEADKYNGFNLIFGIKEKLFYFSNQTFDFKELEEGRFGLSNSLLDTPWQKVEKVKQQFDEIKNNGIDTEDLFNILLDTEAAPDNKLPDSGLPLELERAVSPIFIKTPEYGTRCSTILLIDKRNNIKFIEKTYKPDKDKFETVRFDFEIE